MQNLGNIIKIIFLGVLFSATLQAQISKISVSVSDENVTLGDTVTFNITAVGSNINRPQLTMLCGVKVRSTSQRKSIQTINGVYSEKTVFSYNFMPMKDCQISSFSVVENGKNIQTRAIDISVHKPSQDKNAAFLLELKSEKSSVYVGEPFTVTLTFKQRRNANAVDSKFEPPELKNFWIKTDAQSKNFVEGSYNVTRLTYILSAQKAGSHEITPAKIKIASRQGRRDAWGEWFPTFKWRTYFSNSLQMEVKPLPHGTDIIGNFKLNIKADKREIEVNEAVNVTLKISGSGNFEDIQNMKPTIDGVTVYDEDPKVDAYIENGVYKGNWIQKFAFVSDKDFIIPSFTVSYFDPNTQTTKTLTSKAIEIKVKGSSSSLANQPIMIEKADESVTSDKASKSSTIVVNGIESYWLVIVGLISALLGAGIAHLPWSTLFNKDKKTARLNTKDLRATLQTLFEHREDEGVQEMIDLLEQKLYEGKTITIDKKVLNKLVKKYQ